MDLARAQSTFSCEVEAQTIGGDQGASLVRLPQNPPQGEVQDVRGRVVAHDGPPASLEEHVGVLETVKGVETSEGRWEGSDLVHLKSHSVSDLQSAVNGPDVENVTPADLRVLHRELHPLRKEQKPPNGRNSVC